ncbi:cytochrome C oxidase subunit III, partial [Burkholderia territorii]
MMRAAFRTMRRGARRASVAGVLLAGALAAGGPAAL